MAERQVVHGYGGGATGALSTINALLKDDYVMDQVADLVNRTTYFLSRLTRRKATGGRMFRFSVQTGVSQGVGARAENNPLPDPGFGEYIEANGYLKWLYSQVYITGQAIKLANGTNSYKDITKQALKDARDGLSLDIARQVYGDGSGALGKVATSVTSGTVIPVTDPYGYTYATGVALPNDQRAKTFKRNMSIYIGGSNVACKITGVDNAAGTITVTPAVTVAAGNTIYRGDAVTTGQNSVGVEIAGLGAIVNNVGLEAGNKYLGIDRTNTPEWQGNVVRVNGNVGGNITEGAMQSTADLAAQTGTGAADLILTSYAVRAAYAALLQQQRRFTNPMKLDGGFDAIEFNGRPLVVDKDAPPQHMWFLRMEDLFWMMAADLQWMDEDGAPLSRIAGRDAYGATMFTYRELATDKPANHTVLKNITG